MPLVNVLHRLGSLAAALIPPTPGVYSPDTARVDEADAFERAVLGRWMSENGESVIELRPDGRYNRMSQAGSAWRHGRYEVEAFGLAFEEDSGHVALGALRGGVLSIDGMPFRRARSACFQ